MSAGEAFRGKMALATFAETKVARGCRGRSAPRVFIKAAVEDGQTYFGNTASSASNSATVSRRRTTYILPPSTITSAARGRVL